LEPFFLAENDFIGPLVKKNQSCPDKQFPQVRLIKKVALVIFPP